MAKHRVFIKCLGTAKGIEAETEIPIGGGTSLVLSIEGNCTRGVVQELLELIAGVRETSDVVLGIVAQGVKPAVAVP